MRGVNSPFFLTGYTGRSGMDTIERIRRIYERHEPAPIGKYRFFSVLIPFVEKDGELCLLYEVRARDMESDPGEICFPGGHVEPGEELLAAALRETEEEIGIPADRIEILGQGDVLYGYANYSLYTFIGVIQYRDFLKATIQEEEVDEIFLMPVSHLDFSRAQHFRERVYAEVTDDFPYDEVGIDEDYNWRTGQWIVPVLTVDGRVIWGLTARISEGVVKLLREHHIGELEIQLEVPETTEEKYTGESDVSADK